MSQSYIPNWVRIFCGHWGEQKRRIWLGRDWNGNVDGYANSLVGRIRDERDGASQGQRNQYWPEVFWGDGLAVQRVIHGMPADPSDALHVKYVWDPRYKLRGEQKAALLGMSERAYWEAAGRAEFWVFARLDPSAQAQVVESIRKLKHQLLNSIPKMAQDGNHLIKAPEVSFAALNRSTLSLKQTRS